MSANLLAPPPKLPSTQRNSAGEMDGAAAISSFAMLYDVAGQIRAALIALQEQVRLIGGTDAQGR